METHAMCRRMLFSLVASLLVCAAPAGAQTKQVEVKLGWQPLGGGHAIISAVMIEDKTFGKHAAKYGYQVKEAWKEFQHGPALNEAVAAGHIDIDVGVATIPISARITAGVPSVPIGVSLSPLNVMLLVAPNSPIKDIADLRGKTVGLVVGAAGHYLLATAVYVHLGQTLEEAGIKILNMPLADAVKMYKGVDAAAVWPPAAFMGPAQGFSEILLYGDGTTGKAHRTPGVRLQEVNKSWAYPEGYLLDRTYLFATETFAKDHPDLAVAFLQAWMESTATVAKNQRRALEIINQRWKQPEVVVKRTLDHYAETGGIRNAPYMLESDVVALVKATEFLTFLKLRNKPLTLEDIRPMVMKGAEIQRRVWVAQGSKPTTVELEKGFSGRTEAYGDVIVKGGAPVWQWPSLSNWGTRAYAPGPFKLK